MRDPREIFKRGCNGFQEVGRPLARPTLIAVTIVCDWIHIYAGLCVYLLKDEGSLPAKSVHQCDPEQKGLREGVVCSLIISR